MEMEIRHFHGHQLTFQKHKLIESELDKSCKGCKMGLLFDFYSCEECRYYICKSCAELRPGETLQHPFHGEHPLTLLAQTPCPGEAACNACSEPIEGFIFYCWECGFELDVNCAKLMPCDASTGHKEEEEQQITHWHRHPLIPCHHKKKNGGFDFNCSVCKLPIKEGTIYVRLECRAIMDMSCAQLPPLITHHFHPHPSLTLVKQNDHFSYDCSTCSSFSLDVKWASLMRDDDDHSLQENHLQEEVVQLPFTHEHDLIPCVINTNGNWNFSNFLCSACGTSIEGTVYVCLQCKYLLHKSCAELPQEIKHPFHPPHPLVRHELLYVLDVQCKACRRPILDLIRYRCAACFFEIHIRCASLRPTVKFELHQHPLVFLIKKGQIRFNNCSVHGVCSGHELSFPYFRCVPCKIDIDLSDIVPTLPPTFKHSNHRHLLTLTHSPIKDHANDHDDSEYFCDVCENGRLLKRPTYYCEECHYVAEISCTLKEILPLLEREWSNEEVLMLQEKLNALTVKLEVLIKDLDELKQRRALHIGDDQTDEELIMLQAKADALGKKLETITTKFEEFRKSSAQHIGDYQIGLTEVKTRNASIDIQTFSTIPSSHQVIANPDEEIVMLQAEVDAVTTELETLTTKLDELKKGHLQRVAGNQTGDCNVERMKKEEEDEGSDGTFPTLAELDGKIEATTAKFEELTAELKAITAELEALKKKRASLSQVSSTNEESL